MGKFDGIIIVSDIDGTFLGKNRRIVPENTEAIEYFTSEGGLFTFATGREPVNFLSRFPHPEEFCNAPVVISNGACFYDPQKREILHEEFLPEPEASRIAETMRVRFPEIPFRISLRDKFLGESFCAQTRKTFAFISQHFHEIPYEQMPHGSWYKMGWDGTPEELASVREVLQGIVSTDCRIQLAEKTILEVVSAKATKGAALARLKHLVGLDNALLYAIGDYENDYMMLSMADRRAIPSNAIDLLRTLPDVIEVCHHDEGAIAGLIHHIEASPEGGR